MKQLVKVIAKVPSCFLQMIQLEDSMLYINKIINLNS